MTEDFLSPGRKGRIMLPRNVLNAVFEMARKHSFSEPLAFVYMLCKANYADATVPDGTFVPRGVLYVSKTELLCVFDWYRSKLDRFLTVLEQRGVLEQERTSGGYLLRFVEYDALCGMLEGRNCRRGAAAALPSPAVGGEALPDAADATAAEGTAVPAFEEFWEQYHYVVGRQPVDRYLAERCWNALTPAERVMAVDAIEDYFFSLKEAGYARTAHNYLRYKSFVR